jgi:hypothetical protein
MPAIKTVARKSARAHSRKTAKKVTLDDVWAGFAELQKIHAETEKGLQEFKASQQKAHAETEAAIKETQKALKETQRIVGDLGNKFGEDAEYTLIPSLPEKFKRFGFNFGVMNRNRKINDNEHNIHAEVDAFLENGVQMMAVEVKAKLQKAGVDDHIKRMEKLRAYADLHDDKRDLFGALAATVVSKKEKDYALEKGFFVIEPSGEDVTVTKPSANPKIWQAKGSGNADSSC